MVLEAKCPECDKRAEVDEEMIEVNCKHCGFRARYDEYVEIMKGRAVSMTDDFQMNWDRRPI
jgi:DNA-directed RNA polymerase subunit RPC12/RpoP